MTDLEEKLILKIKVLSDTVWERRCSREYLEKWLNNFAETDNERLHALYILSNFMYFASMEMRELLRSLYRDLVKYPIIRKIRKDNNDTCDTRFIEERYKKELSMTRFLGVGNPSESGYHLLYYFRQQNLLPKSLFIHSHEIFTRANQQPSGQNPLQFSLRDNKIKRYVLIDDFCGSGDQGVTYSRDIVSAIKALKPDAEVAYYVLFATDNGLDTVRQHTLFTDVNSVFSMDKTYKCFGTESRYRPTNNEDLDWDFAKRMCERYGQQLLQDDPDLSKWPLGFDDCQLLIGFFHNVPDNTLPVIWSLGSSEISWYPIFKRYPKIYGEVK